MNALDLKVPGLQMRIASDRLGFGNALALLLVLAGTLGWMYAIPFWNDRLEVLQNSHASAQEALKTKRATPPPAAEKPLAEMNLERFYSTLGEPHSFEQHLKSLFVIAKNSGLTLSQAEYKLAHDKGGRFYTYQILLPVKGPYADVTKFCKETLLSIPFASLGEILLKRDSIGNNTVEAKLRFTLFLAEGQAPFPDTNMPVRVLDK